MHDDAGIRHVLRHTVALLQSIRVDAVHDLHLVPQGNQGAGQRAHIGRIAAEMIGRIKVVTIQKRIRLCSRNVQGLSR